MTEKYCSFRDVCLASRGKSTASSGLFPYIHPVLSAIYPVLFLYSHNMEQLSPSRLYLPLSLATIGVLTLLILINLLTANNIKTALNVTLFNLIFFSYGHVFGVLRKLSDQNDRELMIHVLIMAACISSFAFLSRSIWRMKKHLKPLTVMLNLFAMSLVFISLSSMAVYKLGMRVFDIHEEALARDMHEWLKPGYCDDRDRCRDIYFIVLDAYADHHVLKDVFGFDNREFLDFLRKRGFYIASDSRSNYALTYLSLASTLNMRYINYLSDIMGVESRNRDRPYQMIQNNEVMNILKTRGYRFAHFSSGWGATDQNHHADMNMRYGVGDEFHLLLLQSTMLLPFERYFGFIRNYARNSVLWTFEKLGDMAEQDGPNFVFAHILPPHPPYLFDAAGAPVPGARLQMHGGAWTERKNYVNQLKFINSRLQKLIDQILQASETQPVIILQADHGPASTFFESDSHGWENPTSEMLRERMGIFSAFYLPGGGKEVLYDSVTPVNNFRLVFDYYFSAGLGLLEDRSYYSSYYRPYEFHEYR